MKWSEKIVAIILFAVLIFFSTFHLTESPPTWTDEGIIVNSARVLSETGHVALQVAPGQYESAGTVTTSYPVTAPIALAFRIFGNGLFQARMVMVLYLILFGFLLFYLLRRWVNPEWYLVSFALIITFPPIYGDGKNVLGEIPGLCFMFILLACFYYFEFHLTKEEQKIIPVKVLVLAAASGGLLTIIKPIFLLIVPAFIGAIVVKRFLQKWFVRNNELPKPLLAWPTWLSWRTAILVLVVYIIPILIWIKVQFLGDGLSHIFSVYANPGKLDPFKTMFQNARILLTNAQPLYFLALMVVWFISVVIRIKNKQSVYFAEIFSLLFSLLVILAFLRVPPSYRYFFLAQTLAFVYFVPSLLHLATMSQTIVWHRKIGLALLAAVVFVGLTVYHVYGLTFSSWVALSYGAHQSAELEKYFSNSTSTTYFLYQAPEIATFIHSNNYYQFFEVAPQLAIGSSSKAYIAKGVPDAIVIHSDDESFSVPNYKRVDSVGRYTILRKATK